MWWAVPWALVGDFACVFCGCFCKLYVGIFFVFFCVNGGVIVGVFVGVLGCVCFVCVACVYFGGVLWWVVARAGDWAVVCAVGLGSGLARWLGWGGGLTPQTGL